MSDDQEIQNFIRGYKKFRTDYFSSEKKNFLYEKLVREGQSPRTMVITCSDSRVDPSIILNVLPGELFVVRNVANLVPPFDNNPKHHGTSAALEFAVQTLNVRHIIVLAHSHCGGIRALLSADSTDTNFISSWMNIAHEAKKKVLTQHKNQSLEQQEKICEEESLLISLKNLRSFPWIDEKVCAGVLYLHAWRFDLSTGIIKKFNEQSKQFEAL
jgi:carbonic anhydrase